jgi:plasmid stabilization system protein ParE
MYDYLVEPRAQKEYEQPIAWYSERSELAALNFIKNVDATYLRITKRPYQFKNTYKFFREASVKKYPFVIIYTIEESIKTIIIVSVFHHKRNPKKKYK